MSAYPYDHECNCQDHDTRMVAVPVEGEWLVIDGVARKANVDTANYAGPQVHLITTDEELED